MSAQQFNSGQYQAPNYAPPQQQPQYQNTDRNNNNNYSMQQSQPYAEPQYQQQQPPNQPNFSDSKAQRQDTLFKPKNKWKPRDPIFLVLFIAVVLGYAALSGIVLNQYVKYNGLGGGLGNNSQGGTGSSITLNKSTIYLLLLTSGLALILSAIYLMMVRTFTKIILEITLVLNVAFNIGVAVYYYYEKYWSGAIIFTVIAIISVVTYFFMRSRIPFTRILLQVVIDISKHHPSVYLIVVAGLLVQTAVSIWFAFTSIAIYVAYSPGAASCRTNSCSSGKVSGLIFFATFAYLWISQVVANVTLATLAGGSFGQWYYVGPTAMPKGANARAFARASTTSLGSIAFGSLIVTILELIRMLLQAFQQQEASEGSMVGQILGCVAVCCINCITWAVQYFNKYAYIEIALYGKAYIPAAKDTWHLFKARGVDALVNDSLVSYCFTFGAYLVGLLNALFAFLYLKYAGPSNAGNYNADGSYTAPVLLFAALIGINCGLTLASALESGVSTIFVALATDPDLLQERSPLMYSEVQRAYPNVLSGV